MALTLVVKQLNQARREAEQQLAGIRQALLILNGGSRGPRRLSAAGRCPPPDLDHAEAALGALAQTASQQTARAAVREAEGRMKLLGFSGRYEVVGKNAAVKKLLAKFNAETTKAAKSQELGGPTGKDINRCDSTRDSGRSVNL